MASTSLPLPVPHGGFPGDSLPRLTQETELQKMLTDEKLRSDQHKINYQQLKVEHGRLQEEFLEIQHELRTTIEESRLVQDKYKTLYEQSAREAGDLQAELEELRTNVITPQRLEIIRIQLTDEIEKPFREKYKAQEAQIEESTASYNKLRYEFSFLKSEYDHSLQEHQRITEELKLQHEAEVSNLRKERDATVTKIQSDISQDSQRVRVLQRENAQLHLKLKGLLSELEEIRAQKEQLGVQSEQVARSQAKQATEYSANIKSLEAERDSLRKQVETVQRELTASVDQHTKFTSRIHELEKENMTMKNRVEEILHKGKVEVTDIKMEMLKQRGDLVRERDTLQNKLEDLKANLEIANHKVEQQERLLVEKERDAVRRVQAAREEEWVKTAQADNEKLELETKLQEMERRRIDQDTQREADRERVEDRIKAVNDARETAERETLVLRAKIQNQDSLQNQLERERGENSELKSRINQLETEISAHNSNQYDIVDTNSKLRNAVELLKDELRMTREQLNRAQDSNDKVLAQQRASWLDEKSQLDLRIHELGEQKNHLGSKLNKVTAVHKKYKKKCHKIMNNLKDKTQILEAKTEEMELEKIALQKCVPQDIYNKLKKQLKELQRRHNEFRSLLLGSGNVQQVSIGEMSFGMISLPFDYTLPQNSFTEQEKRHQEDLRLLKQRLDTLDDNQQQQLAEFREIAHSTLQPLPDFDDSKEKADIEKLSFEISTTETEIRRFHEKNETEKQSYEVEKVESDMKRYQSADDEKTVV